MLTQHSRSLKGLLPLILLLAMPVVGAAQAAQAPAQSGFQPVDARIQVTQMRRGVNIIGYDPLWQDFSKARFQERHFQRIHDGGFQTVRINLHAFSHMDAEGKLDPAWLKTLDWAVEKALAAGLTVILDEHNYEFCGKDSVGCGINLLAFWKQIAPRYRDAPAAVIFEILNEPNGAVDDKTWNSLLLEALGIIRETNPERNVIIGPAFWNNIDHLSQLALPAEDRHIIATVHYYLPMRFTHQGAKWNKEGAKLSGVTWGTDEERRRMEADFAMVQEWAKANDRPMLLGEFGAYDKAPMESRVRYTAHAARTAEALGWAWTYWQFDADFILFDMNKDAWVEPIHKALAP